MTTESKTNNRRLRGGLVSEPGEKYSERVRYSDYIEELKLTSQAAFLDTLRGDKRLYGFIHPDTGCIVEPNPELRSFGDYAGEIVGLNFVVDCFNQFRDYYLKAVQETGITAPVAFSGLVVKKSYEDMSERYQEYQRLVSEALIEPFVTGDFSSGEGPMPFDEFVDSLDQVIFLESKKQYKITKTGFVLSRYITAYQTGLYVDFLPESDPSIDYIKVEILSDPGFECYAQTANDFGFLVDQNCPWRLVLDLNSENVQKNILNSDFSRPFWDFYSEEYLIKTGSDDYWRLQSFYKRMYLKYIKIKGITDIFQSVLDSIDEKRWIQSYLLNRLREIGALRSPDFYSSDEDPTENKKRYQNILTNAIERYNILEQQGLSKLTHNSGVILFIEEECTDILKERLRATIDNSANS